MRKIWNFAFKEKHASSKWYRIFKIYNSNGDGIEPSINEEMIQLPIDMVIISKNDVNPLSKLIETIFPNLSKNAFDKEYIVNRALITPLNEYVDKFNELYSIYFLEMKSFTILMMQ